MTPRRSFSSRRDASRPTHQSISSLIADLVLVTTLAFVVFGATSLGAQSSAVNEVEVEDVSLGSGSAVARDAIVAICYDASTASGESISTNYGLRPLTFSVGGGAVIAGLSEGLIGMKEGGVRVLRIPSSLAYGAKGLPGRVPANRDLIYHVRLRLTAPASRDARGRLTHDDDVLQRIVDLGACSLNADDFAVGY